MADKGRVPQTKFATDFNHIVRVACQRRIFGRVVRLQVGPAGADVIKQDSSELASKGGFHEPPHVLITAESMGKQHGTLARSANADIISFDYAHYGTLRLSHQE